MKGLKYIIGYSLIAAYIIVMMGFVNVNYDKVYCKDLNIVIKDSINTRFVQKSDILSLIKEKQFEWLTILPQEIDLDSLEATINRHSSIKNCECYFLSNSTLQIDITQRRPIARVMTERYNFYLDEEGQEMPPSRFYTAHVPIITGKVKKAHLEDLYHICSFLQDNAFWEAQVEQIIVQDNGDYAFIPRAGNHLIELGSAENIEGKLESLKALYLQIFNNNAWNKYKKISLKYDGQIVCTKK